MFYAQTAVKWNEKQSKATMRSRKVSAFWFHTRTPAGNSTLLALQNKESLANAARACKVNGVSTPIGTTWAATPGFINHLLKEAMNLQTWLAQRIQQSMRSSHADPEPRSLKVFQSQVRSIGKRYSSQMKWRESESSAIVEEAGSRFS